MIKLCREAITEAEAAGEDGALAHACFILDWALFDSGRPQEATHSHRSLEIYERLGEFDRQAAVLNNLGGFIGAKQCRCLLSSVSSSLLPYFYLLQNGTMITEWLAVTLVNIVVFCRRAPTPRQAPFEGAQ